jgi:hypothetical protein
MPRLRFALLLATICVLAIGCSSAAHHTDTKAAMARLNYSPEQCEQIGPSIRNCGGPNSLPGAAEGMAAAASTNDAEAIRGICPAGSTYVQGKGCQINDK